MPGIYKEANTCSVQLVYKVALVMQEYTQSGGVRSIFIYIKIINFKTVGKVNFNFIWIWILILT
jgi:hypothetical protein